MMASFALQEIVHTFIVATFITEVFFKQFLIRIAV